jgi:hypothetical protein
MKKTSDILITVAAVAVLPVVAPYVIFQTLRAVRLINKQYKREAAKQELFARLMNHDTDEESLRELSMIASNIHISCDDCNFSKLVCADEYAKYRQKHTDKDNRFICPECGGENINGYNIGML